MKRNQKSSKTRKSKLKVPKPKRRTKTMILNGRCHNLFIIVLIFLYTPKSIKILDMNLEKSKNLWKKTQFYHNVILKVSRFQNHHIHFRKNVRFFLRKTQVFEKSLVALRGRFLSILESFQGSFLRSFWSQKSMQKSIRFFIVFLSILVPKMEPKCTKNH